MDSLSLSAKYSRSFNDPSTTEIPEVSQSIEHSPEQQASPEPAPVTDQSLDHILSEIQQKPVGGTNKRRKQGGKSGEGSAWSGSSFKKSSKSSKKASRSRPASAKNLLLSPLLSSPIESVNRLSRVTSSSAVTSLYHVISSRMKASGQQALSPEDLQDIKSFFEAEQVQFEEALTAKVEGRPLPPYEVHKREKTRVRNCEIHRKHEEIKDKRQKEEISMARKAVKMMKNSAEDRLALHILHMGQKLERQRKLESTQATREQLSRSLSEKAIILSNIRNFYHDRMELLKEKISAEREKARFLEIEQRQVSPSQTLARAEQERKAARRAFLEQTRSRLELATAKLELETLNQSRLETELIRMYKRS